MNGGHRLSAIILFASLTDVMSFFFFTLPSLQFTFCSGPVSKTNAIKSSTVPGSLSRRSIMVRKSVVNGGRALLNRSG